MHSDKVAFVLVYGETRQIKTWLTELQAHTSVTACHSPKAVHLDQVAFVLVHYEPTDDHVRVKAQPLHRHTLQSKATQSIDIDTIKLCV